MRGLESGGAVGDLGRYVKFTTEDGLAIEYLHQVEAIGVQRMISLRKRHPVFRRRRFFQGRPIKGASVKDVLWLNASGNEMSEDEWRDPSLHCLGMFLSGEGLDETDERGRKLRDENFLLLFNAHHEDLGFILPAFRVLCREQVFYR